MKAKLFLLGLGIILISIGLTITLGFSQKNVPLPQDIQILPPSSDLPAEIAAFSGRWGEIGRGTLIVS